MILPKPVSSCKSKEPLDGSFSFPLFVLRGDESTLEVFMLPTPLDFAAGMNTFPLINTKQTLDLAPSAEGFCFYPDHSLSLQVCSSKQRDVVYCCHRFQYYSYPLKIWPLFSLKSELLSVS